jgi:hypothetical protein
MILSSPQLSVEVFHPISFPALKELEIHTPDFDVAHSEMPTRGLAELLHRSQAPLKTFRLFDISTEYLDIRELLPHMPDLTSLTLEIDRKPNAGDSTESSMEVVWGLTCDEHGSKKCWSLPRLEAPHIDALSRA